MAGPATPEAIAARWRPLSDDEYVKALTLLEDAWTLITLRNSTVEARLTAGTLPTDLVVMVQAAMVIRVLRNPDGLRQESSEDYSYIRDDSSATGELTITDAELALLDTDATVSTAGAFTIRPYSETPVYTFPNDLTGWGDPYWWPR